MYFPNDKSYQFLIRCSIKPNCEPCREDNVIYLADNSTARQAIQGRINFFTFRRIAEGIAKENICRTLTAKGVEARELLNKPEIKAFLDVLAVVEGADKNHNDGVATGYDTLGGTSGSANKPLIQDLSKHPGRVAAGRYQAIPDTWAQDAKTLGLTDFTPESQDIFGAWKLKSRAMADDILNNRILDAIDKGSPEWASLPNRAKTVANGGKPTSYHVYSRGQNKGKPQPVPHSAEELQSYFVEARKIYQNKK